MSNLICGLGNPGPRYELTRHNIGFLVLDFFSDRHQIKLGLNKHQGEVGKGTLFNHPVILLKPQTFMNLSGDSVAQACRFFKIPIDNLIVVHDDLDFPFGTVRVKMGGSHGGHNGLRSIIEVLGTPEFIRIRMGIGRPTTPMDPADFVLQRFSKEQEEMLESVVSQGADAIDSILQVGLTATMNLFNQRREEQ